MVFFSKTERECNGSHSALFVSMKGGNGMKSRSHIFALITACVFLFCGCSDYLSLSKASTISNPQTEYDTALKEYLASLETPLSTIEIKHGEDTPIVWEDTGMEAAVRLLLNCPEGTISRSDVWNLNTLTITERTMFEGDSVTITIVTVTAQQGDATLEQEISAVGKEVRFLRWPLCTICSISTACKPFPILPRRRPIRHSLIFLGLKPCPISNASA